ncbi:MAG: sulfatase-like hydrolase/transferase [Runella sp.]
MIRKLLFLIGIVLNPGAEASPVHGSGKPNIILILADDMGIGDVGCYGQKIIKTPHIDRVALEGVRFTDFYAGSAVCSPSRCSLLTGKHTGHTDIRSNKNHPDFGPYPLNPQTQTVAQVLKKTGYQTALCGRWHMGEYYSASTPDKMGFCYTFGPLASFFKSNAPRFRADLYENGKEYIVEQNLNGKKGVFIEDLLTEKGLAFVEQNRSQPFFLYMAYSLVHDPLEIDDLGKYKHRNYPETEKAFAASVERLDSYVGRFATLLKKLNLEENTLLIVTSDNGPHAEGGHDPHYFDSNGAFRGIKRDLYEGGIRMPFVAQWKGKITPNYTVATPAAFWDVMPTFAELAQVPSPPTDGLSFVPSLLGKPQQSYRYLYWEFTENRPKQAIRVGKWKGLYWVDSRIFELYDLEKDPAESKNVADIFPLKVQELQKFMHQAHTSHPDFPLLENESYVQISTRDTRYLALDNGATFIPIGPNICFPRFLTTEAEILSYYENYFKKTAENGGNFTRIWLSVPAFEVEHTTPGSYDFRLAQRMDKIVAMAEKYRIKIKFCLEHFRKITNSPARFAGSVAFERPVYQENVADMDSFFLTKTGKKLYLDRVEFWANRFAKNPNVFGWELWNEINAVSVRDQQKLYDWTRIMLPEVKKRLPRQLIMQSLGSFDREEAIEMYRQYSQLADNQLVQTHRYLDEGAALAVCQASMDELAADAVQTLRRFTKKKPVVLSEVGAVEPHHAGPWRFYSKDTIGVLLHDLLFAPFFAGAAAPGQSWHWDFYIEKNNLWWHFGRFKEAIRGFDPISQQAEPYFTKSGKGLKIYELRGKNAALMWIRDGNNHWKTELVEGQQALPATGHEIDIPLEKAKNVSFYDPWKNLWTKGEIEKDNRLKLPVFRRSLVVKIEY